MGLKGLAQGLVSQGFSVAGDIAEAVEFVSISQPRYNATTGAVTEYGEGFSVNVLIMDYTYEEKQAALNISDEDVKCLIPTQAMTAVPKVGDAVKRGVSTEAVSWAVLSVEVDIAESIWTLQLRRQKNVN